MGWRALDVAVQLLDQIVKGGVPADGVGSGEVFLEKGEGAGAGDGRAVVRFHVCSILQNICSCQG